MFLFRTSLPVEVIIPVEVAVIVILTVVAYYSPGAVGVFRFVISTVVKHLQVIFRIVCHQLSLIRFIEGIDNIYMIIACCYEVG